MMLKVGSGQLSYLQNYASTHLEATCMKKSGCARTLVCRLESEKKKKISDVIWNYILMALRPTIRNSPKILVALKYEDRSRLQPRVCLFINLCNFPPFPTISVCVRLRPRLWCGGFSLSVVIALRSSSAGRRRCFVTLSRNPFVDVRSGVATLCFPGRPGTYRIKRRRISSGFKQ